MSWIEEVHQEVSVAESPRSFITWAAIAAIAAVAKRNVWIQRKNIYKLYPNLYVLIVGPSGVRKSLPVNIVKKLVSQVNNTRVILGQNSIQGVVHTLSKAYTKDRHIPLVDAHGLLISEEFSNFILSDPTSLTILTALYDTHDQDRWEKTLKGSHQEILTNVCLSLFGATSDDHFKDRILDKDIKGGFMARVLCVYETKIGQINPLLDYEGGDDIELPGVNYENLARRLIEISTLSGKMRITKAAYDLYVPWYEGFISQHHPWDRTGISRRIHDHMLKVAICLSLADRDDLVIDAKEMEAASNLCLPLMRNTEVVLRGKGKSDIGEHSALFLDLLISRPDFTISRAEVLGKHYEDFSAGVLNMIVDTLSQGKKIASVVRNGETFYKLSDESIEVYKKLVEKGVV